MLIQIARRTVRRAEPVKTLQIKKKMEAEHNSYPEDPAFPMKPQRILSDVRKVMGREDIVISDIGAHKIWIARLVNREEVAFSRLPFSHASERDFFQLFTKFQHFYLRYYKRYGILLKIRRM